MKPLVIIYLYNIVFASLAVHFEENFGNFGLVNSRDCCIHWSFLALYETLSIIYVINYMADIAAVICIINYTNYH